MSFQAANRNTGMGHASVPCRSSFGHQKTWKSDGNSRVNHADAHGTGQCLVGATQEDL